MMEWALQITQGVLMVALVPTLVRVVKGPSLPDRVIAVDMAASIVVAIILVHCLETGSFYYLTAATVVALVAFLGTVSLALYMRRGGAS
ncbi:MAG: pH regulation protein F [Kiritimatiellaceae bacterium]|nr:MAG: pH regulation protein F [Kiritimatiellaceae bacterium]|tara:strand:- start:112 stop:378 length:267 start_codon:yes stop_codon:yes gene_type:complete